jgi:hypothetical protein
MRRRKLLPRLLAVAACAAAGAAFATDINAQDAAGQAHIEAAQVSINACHPEPTTPELAAALGLTPGQTLHAGQCGTRLWALVTPDGQNVTTTAQVFAAEPDGPYAQIGHGSDPCTVLPLGLVFEWQLACP